MATKIGLFGQSVRKILHNPMKNNVNVAQKRTVVYSDSGAILPKPEQMRFPLPKVLLAVVPFLTTGAVLSKNGASILEEMEIFVPEDDDD
jgi:hypothetical protein